MDDNFNLRAALKSDEELHRCIDNREKYLPETVEAAVQELQSRGVEFSEEELNVIAEDMKARRDLAKAAPENFGWFSNRDKNNQVEDPEAPAFFSKRAIFAFEFKFKFFYCYNLPGRLFIRSIILEQVHRKYNPLPRKAHLDPLNNRSCNYRTYYNPGN